MHRFIQITLGGLVAVGGVAFLIMAWLNASALDAGLAGLGSGQLKEIKQPKVGKFSRFGAAKKTLRRSHSCKFSNDYKVTLGAKTSCKKVATQIRALSSNGTSATMEIAAAMTQQLSFLVLAALVVILGLAMTTAASVFLDWLGFEVGFASASFVIQRLVDTIPYTVWLIVLVGLHLSLAYSLSNWLYNSPNEQTIIGLSAQAVAYLGVFLLLMPLFPRFLN